MIESIRATYVAKIIFFLSLFSVSQTTIVAQDATNGVTIDATNQTYESLINEIESQSGVKVYYKQGELPQVTTNLAITDGTVEDALGQLLSTTALNYLKYSDKTFVIMPRGILAQDFSAKYYEVSEGADTEVSRRVREVGEEGNISPDGYAEVTGTIRDKDSKESIIGATVLWSDINEVTVTDVNGKFTSRVPAGIYDVLIQYLAYEDETATLKVNGNGSIRFSMTREAIELEEAVVTARATDNSISGASIGLSSIKMEEVKKQPAFLGEADVIKSLIQLPGVSTTGEGASGLNVRGGRVDQNLILQDEGFILNSSHALGFFSTFNADLVNSVDLYKGNMPANFGGRLASVMDVKMRDGAKDRFKIKGGIGVVSSRLSLEGPIVKGKSSFIGGLRSSYSDWLLGSVDVPEVQNSSVSFYDANARFSTEVGKAGKFIVSGYAASDEFVYNNEYGFNYSTMMGEVDYNHTFSDNVLAKFSGVYSDYQSDQQQFTGISGQELATAVKFAKAKAEVIATPTSDLILNAGIQSIQYDVAPGDVTPLGDSSLVLPIIVENDKARESAGFISVQKDFDDKLTVIAGARAVFYQYLGPQEQLLYQNEDLPSLSEITDTVSQTGVISSQFNFEPRLSARYKINETTSVKAGYSRTAQYINQLYNSDSPTPTSTWQLTTQYIKPAKSHNVSLGVFKNFQDNNIEISLEGYYRLIDQLTDLKDFAKLDGNQNIETEILTGEGSSVGLEFSVRKKKGKVNGFLAYTYSKTENTIPGINLGDTYFNSFDKPHDMTALINFNPSIRHTITFNFTYSSGRPTTPPVGSYTTPSGIWVPVFATRNQFRIPDYHRLDVAYTISQGFKKKTKVKTSWTLGIYNVYGRKNAFSVFYEQGISQTFRPKKLSILGSAFPSLTVNFELQ